MSTAEIIKNAFAAPALGRSDFGLTRYHDLAESRGRGNALDPRDRFVRLSLDRGSVAWEIDLPAFQQQACGLADRELTVGDLQQYHIAEAPCAGLPEQRR